MKTVDLVKTTYPKLAHILDEDVLAEISSIESKEREFIKKTANPLQQYLKALYLKSMRYLGHCRFNPGRMPLQLRMRLIDELELPRSLVSTKRIARSQKSNIVRDVRAFLGMTKCN